MDANAGKGNLILGTVGGAVAALLGATLWAIITITTEYQIGWMAVGIGFLVGYAVRSSGKGSTPVFGVAGAVLALFGCLAGNALAVVGFIARAQGVNLFDAFSLIELGDFPDLLAETFSAMDLLFYAIAIYEGFQLSMVPASSQEFVAAT